VASGFDPGALLGGSYPLEDGTRIRLRLARVSDGPAIRALIAAEAERGGAGVEHAWRSGELEVARLIHFDPRRHCVLAAMALIDGRETLVGVGSIPLDGPDEFDPEILVVHPRVGFGLAELMTAALVGRAQAIARARAA